jgi:hypothetical protein
MMHRHVFALMFAVAFGAVTASVALAQAVPQPVERPARPGWSLTPSIGYGQIADDNVLVQGKEAAVSGDLLSVITPRAALDFNGQRGHLSVDYSGTFEFYRQFDSLDNFNQFEAVAARRLMTPHTSLFVQQQFALTPTTELPAAAGIPFARVGARVVGLRGGIDHSFTKHTTLSAFYSFQNIAFDKHSTPFVLVGGFGNGASMTVRHETTARMTLLVDYDFQRTSVIDNGASSIQNLRAGGEYRFSATSSLFAEGGIARLGPNALSPAHTGPSFQAGMAHKLRRGDVGVTYTVGYVPSFGNGQTIRSDDVGAHLRMTISRRLYSQGSLNWRRDDPLSGPLVTLLGEQNLRTLLFTGLVGYPASRFLHVEGFFMASRQTVSRPGGDVNINRVGIQAVMTGKPARLR